MMVDNDGPTMTMYDGKGKKRTVLHVSPQGPGLALCDHDEDIRAVLSVDENVTMFRMYDERERPRAGMVVSEEGSRLLLIGRNGEPTWSAS